MKIKYYSFWFVAILTLVVVSCGDDDSTDDGTSEFDRAAMLESMATNLIIPNFESLQTSVNQLVSSSDDFVASNTEQNLTALRAAWAQAVIDHQHCSAFGFGPASLSLGPYASVLGVFPVNEDQVETNILNGDFNPSSSFDRDVRGFYAVEYLLYGNESTAAEIVAGFDQDRKDYLLILVNELKTTLDAIVSEWNTTYLQEFIASDGTSAGSSVSLMYNEFVKDYENLKNFKIELPAGLTAGQGGADGSLVEAFYSGISSDLIFEHFENSKNIWAGQSRSGQNIVGFEEYLESVVGGAELITNRIFSIANKLTVGYQHYIQLRRRGLITRY